jgi:regulator of replication initiation timing
VGILETAKDVVTLVQKADNLELVKQILALQSDIMKMMEENRVLRDENLTLKEQLHAKKTLVFRNNHYWMPKEDGSEDGPFCSACQDGYGQLARMTEGATRGYYFCKVCQIRKTGRQ